MPQEIDQLKQRSQSNTIWKKHYLRQQPAIRKVFDLLERPWRQHYRFHLRWNRYRQRTGGQAIHYNKERKSKPFVAIKRGRYSARVIGRQGLVMKRVYGRPVRRIGSLKKQTKAHCFGWDWRAWPKSAKQNCFARYKKRSNAIGQQPIIKLVRIIVATHKTLGRSSRRPLPRRFILPATGLYQFRCRLCATEPMTFWYWPSFPRSIHKRKPTQQNQTLTRSATELSGYVSRQRAWVAFHYWVGCRVCENSEIKDTDVTFGNAPTRRAYLMKEMTLEDYTTTSSAHSWTNTIITYWK